MRARHLKSDFSEQETRFITEGGALIGTGNTLTELFKYVGYYDECELTNRECEIFKYNPNDDCIFKYENWGYTKIRRRLKEKQKKISRKYIKNISRKWSPSRVVLSFDTMLIIEELFSFIMEKELLKKACENYYKKDIPWNEYMPIQFDFLSERFNDHHKDWQIAESILMQLRGFAIGE